MPSSPSKSLSSPYQSLVVPVSISGRVLPKYGCFTSAPVKPSIVFIV